MTQSDFDPDHIFNHHHATPEKLASYAAIHEAAKRFAEVLLKSVPPCTDRDVALRHLRESAMMACAAISLDGRWK